MNLRLQLLIDYYIGGFLHFLLKPLVILAGKILRREHDLRKCRSVTVIKMLAAEAWQLRTLRFLPSNGRP